MGSSSTSVGMEALVKLLILIPVLLQSSKGEDGTTTTHPPSWTPPPHQLQPSHPTNLVRTDSSTDNLHKTPTEVLPAQASGVQQSASPDPVIPLIPHIPELPRQNQGPHISEFTNPKTGHNPFLDLIEGTSTSTSRVSSIIEERKNSELPSPAEAPPPARQQPSEESRWSRARHPTSSNAKPKQHTIRFPTSRTSEYPVEGNTGGRPKFTTEPIEGTSEGGRPRLPFGRPRGNHRYNPPPPLKDDVPIRIWTKPSNEVPWTPSAPPHIKSEESTSAPTTSTTNAAPSTPQIPYYRSTPGTTKIAMRPSDRNKDRKSDIDKESIVPTVNSKQNIYTGGMITGAAVVFFAALMAICMWRQRAKTLSRRDTRFIADHDINNQSKEVCGKSAIFSSKMP